MSSGVSLAPAASGATKITIKLNVDFFAAREAGLLPAHGKLVFTGPIDAYFAANQFRDIHGENWAQARTGDLTADREMVLRYRSLVEKASRAWEAAYKTSSRLEWEDWLPAKEAKRARRAEALLRVAGDESETLHARAAAAQKAATLLKKVTGFLLPEQVERALADGSRLALPGGSRP